MTDFFPATHGCNVYRYYICISQTAFILKKIAEKNPESENDIVTVYEINYDNNEKKY